MSSVTSAPTAGASQDLVVIPTEAYLSEQYARAEKAKLWSKVWQIACRTEELPKVGDYVTYDILDESVIVVRSAPRRSPLITMFASIGAGGSPRAVAKRASFAAPFTAGPGTWMGKTSLSSIATTGAA